ncbi:hypothetical protein [Kitasatospora sp. GP82]|uniref:hypothetical protein n=1 Tax=Kitasatospora sp. GP82 TaxID=3035089 RepID=UPI0024753976|nr:hypothetical protein [Kitasatospora sp. GP82]
MRLRNAAAAVTAAIALVLTMPTSASAATGEFTYRWNGPTGTVHHGKLIDPASRECINIPEVEDPAIQPAHTPWNFTDSTVTVFTDVDCDGDYFSLRPNGGHASDRLKFRSVVFS